MSYEQVEDLYPLSPMQQGMLFSSLLAPQSGVYVEQRLCSLHGTLNVPAFERAWQQVADRHPVMRTSFVWEGVEQPVQVVHTQAELPLEQQDWRGIEQSQQQTQLEEFLKTDRRRGFDLLAAPLARLTLLRMDDDTYQFIWTYHHLLMDGWSGPLLVKEVFEFYGAFCRNEHLSLPLPRPYRDYIAWLQQQDLTEAERFWRETLKGFDAPVTLNLKRATYELPPHEETSGTLRVRLSTDRTAAISATLREHKLTLNALIQGAWALLLSRYSGTQDIVFGAVVSGRPPELPGVEQMVGLFINTLPVRVQVSPRAKVLSYLEKIQESQFERQHYEYSSLAQIHGWSEVPRGVSLYESLLVFENYPFEVPEDEQRETISTADAGDTLEARNFRFEEEINYSLSLTIIPGSELAFRLIYDRRRFNDDTVQRLMGHFEHLLEELGRQPEQLLSSLSLLSAAERRQLVLEWNETAHPLPGPQCLHELVMEQARRTPEAIALIGSSGAPLTYRELDERSNQLAHYLRGLGVSAEMRVGLCLQRSEQLVVGLLGILKAGGCYMPLDVQYPLARLERMLEESGVALVVTEEELIEGLPAHWARVVSVDGEWAEISQESVEAIESGVSGENLAYVIYTSGSTGQPKGVLVTHSALVNFTRCAVDHFGLDASDRLLQFLSPSFDAFGEELYPTLCSGATLVMHRHPAELSLRELLDFCELHAVTALHIPPVYIKQMLKELSPGGRRLPAGVKLLITGGESVTGETIRKLQEAGGERMRILHVYGPSETTITATQWEVGAVEGTGRVAIGRPLWNVQVYVLDQDEELVAVGVMGELYIGGAGVARGYEGDARQTAERFVPDRWSGVAGGRVYRTGDLVRYREGGALEFVGRGDEQVKLHGHRIELEEIEAALGELEGVRDAVVLLREDVPNEKRLVAYVVPAGESAIDAGELREKLKKRLPLYMIPVFVMLDSLPMTAHGKVDYQALPAPEDFTQFMAHTYVAPRTPLEEVLAKIWADVLGIERVGINDDFFQLGGHSMLATQIISQVREALQTEVPFNTIFDSPTVGGMALTIEQSQVEAGSDEDMEQMLTELENLSEDDVKLLLEMESTQREQS